MGYSCFLDEVDYLLLKYFYLIVCFIGLFCRFKKREKVYIIYIDLVISVFNIGGVGWGWGVVSFLKF